MSFPTLEYAMLPSGLRLAYAQRGVGEPVLCLSGYTDSSRSFAQLLEAQPPGLRVLALTHRGHGDSEHPTGDYRIEDLAADARAFLDVLRLPRACVVGHSLGSFVAQELALRHPERVSHLVLIGSADSPDSPAIRELAAEVEQLEDPIDRDFVRAFQESTVHHPLPALELERFVDESLKAPARVWKAVLAGMRQYDAGRRLRSLSVPTLLLWGERDIIFDRQAQRRLHALLPHAALDIYRDTGHALHWERPAEFAADLSMFVQGGLHTSPHEAHAP